MVFQFQIHMNKLNMTVFVTSFNKQVNLALWRSSCHNDDSVVSKETSKSERAATVGKPNKVITFLLQRGLATLFEFEFSFHCPQLDHFVCFCFLFPSEIGNFVDPIATESCNKARRLNFSNSNIEFPLSDEKFAGNRYENDFYLE